MDKIFDKRDYMVYYKCIIIDIVNNSTYWIYKWRKSWELMKKTEGCWNL